MIESTQETKNGNININSSLEYHMSIDQQHDFIPLTSFISQNSTVKSQYTQHQRIDNLNSQEQNLKQFNTPKTDLTNENYNQDIPTNEGNIMGKRKEIGEIKTQSHYSENKHKQYELINQYKNQSNRFNINKQNHVDTNYNGRNNYTFQNQNTSQQRYLNNIYNKYNQSSNIQKNKKYFTTYIPKTNLAYCGQENIANSEAQVHKNIIITEEQNYINQKIKKQDECHFRQNFQSKIYSDDQEQDNDKYNNKANQFENPTVDENKKTQGFIQKKYYKHFQMDDYHKNKFNNQEVINEQQKNKSIQNFQKNKDNTSKIYKQSYLKNGCINKYNKPQFEIQQKQVIIKKGEKDLNDSLQEEYDLSDEQGNCFSDNDKKHQEYQGLQTKIQKIKDQNNDEKQNYKNQRIMSRSIDHIHEDNYNLQIQNKQEYQTHSQIEINEGKKYTKNNLNYYQNIQNRSFNSYLIKQFSNEGGDNTSSTLNSNSSSNNNFKYQKNSRTPQNGNQYFKKSENQYEREVDDIIKDYLSDEDDIYDTQQKLKMNNQKKQDKHFKHKEKSVYVVKEKQNNKNNEKFIKQKQSESQTRNEDQQLFQIKTTKQQNQNKSNQNFYNQTNDIQNFNNLNSLAPSRQQLQQQNINFQKNNIFNQHQNNPKNTCFNKGQISEIKVNQNKDQNFENYNIKQNNIFEKKINSQWNNKSYESENNDNQYFVNDELNDKKVISRESVLNSNQMSQKYVFVERNKLESNTTNIQISQESNELQKQQKSEQTILKDVNNKQEQQIFNNTQNTNQNKCSQDYTIQDMNKIHPMRQMYISKEDYQQPDMEEHCIPKQKIQLKSKIDRLREKWSNQNQQKDIKELNTNSIYEHCIESVKPNNDTQNMINFNVNINGNSAHENNKFINQQNAINLQIYFGHYQNSLLPYSVDPENQNFQFFSPSYNSQCNNQQQRMQEYETFQQTISQELYQPQQINIHQNQYLYHPNSYIIGHNQNVQPQLLQQNLKMIQNQTPQINQTTQIPNQIQNKNNVSVLPQNSILSFPESNQQVKQDSQLEQQQSQYISNLVTQSFFSFYVLKKEIKIDDFNWYYIDNSGNQQGPFSSMQMDLWNVKKYFPDELKIKFQDQEWCQISIFLQENPISQEEADLDWILQNINESPTIQSNRFCNM